MPSLVEFLNHVLPSEGYYCWWYKDANGIPWQGFTSTVEQLAAAVTQIDALQCDAFFALSTYKEPTNRKAANVKFTKSFWLDIDAGPGKPYPDYEAALAALDSFCARAGWDLPTAVRSGGGLHAYWVSPAPIEPDEWVASAKRLKSRIATDGLLADGARTSDICSILRPINTFNWKIRDTPRPVSCNELMDGAMPLHGLAGSSPESTQPAFQPNNELAQNLSAIYGPREPSYGNIAADHCQQLRKFRDTRGNINEPLWYAGLGLLAQCEDGRSVAHEWSSGYAAYTAEETDRKFNQAKNNSDATTCQRYKELDADGCVGCPFKITSPIQLGRIKPQKAPPAAEKWPELPPGYSMNHNYQLCVEQTKKDDHGVVTKSWAQPFTKFPIYLSEIRNGQVETKQGLFFRQWEPISGWSEFEISAKNIAGIGTWGELADHGALMLDPDSRKHFLKYIDKSYKSMLGAKKMRYDQLGWKDDFQAFYYAGQLYKNDGTIIAAAGSAECVNRSEKMGTGKNGSLAAWSAAANKLFIDGCEAQSFALLTSFASPLMAFVTPPGEGGTVLSLVSPLGGTGKSTTLIAIASVWGRVEAIRLLGSDTTTSKFRIIAILNSFPVIYDELRDRHSELILEFMQRYTTGRDRNRSRTDGSVQPIEFTFCNILTSASNKSLVDAITSAEKGSTEAMADRVFEVEMVKPKDAVFDLNGAVGRELEANRGQAGKAYLAYLMQPGIIEWARASLQKLMDYYIERTGATTTHRYIIRQVACVAVAGAICKHLGLMEFSIERIIDWALLEVINRVTNMPKFEPWQTLTNIIDDNAISSCVVVQEKHNSKRRAVLVRSPRFDTQMRYEVLENKLYIAVGWIKQKMVEKGQPFSLVAKALEEKGILINRKARISLNAGLDQPGGQIYCWELDMGHELMTGVFVKEVLPLAMKAV